MVAPRGQRQVTRGAWSTPSGRCDIEKATRPLTVVVFGNLEPEHSTENEWAKAWADRGHTVIGVQEGALPAADTADVIVAHRPDLVWWTQTYGLAVSSGSVEERWEALARIKAWAPVAGGHLDRWCGLPREDQVGVEPFFRGVDVLFTADGGHDETWERYGVTHVWLPPGVSRFECVPHVAEPERWGGVDVGFVGNHAGGYHPEWVHRRQLVRWLRRTYRGRVGFWPVRGEPAVRGDALRSLYASVPVLVGDSCLVGGAVRYASDRIPETLGRGGALVHPHVEGVTDGTLWTAREHLACWPLNDWASLKVIIDDLLADEPFRHGMAEAGRLHTLAHHTYTHRVAFAEWILAERGLL